MKQLLSKKGENVFLQQQEAKEKNDRKAYFNDYNNRPEIKAKRKLVRLKKVRAKKEKEQERESEVKVKYYGAEAFKVLMSLKEYTELNQEKKKIWLNFIWTYKDLNEITTPEQKIHIPQDIIQVMKFREEADKLINDYWETAKGEIRKGKRWDSLDEEQKERLIKYWGQEKVRWENKLDESFENQVEKGSSYEKEIKKMVDVSKLHEERGKIKCKCYSCEELKLRKAEEKAELAQLIKEAEKEKKEEVVKGECVNCYEWKKISAESGLCKKCENEDWEVKV